MYIVELGDEGSSNYFCFCCKSYNEAVKLLKTITDNGYSAKLSFEEKE